MLGGDSHWEGVEGGSFGSVRCGGPWTVVGLVV